MANLEQVKRAKEIIEEYKMEVLKFVKKYFEANRKIVISDEVTNVQVYSFERLCREINFNGDTIEVNIHYSDANGDWIYNVYPESIDKTIEPPTNNTLTIQGELSIVFPNVVGCEGQMEKTIYMRKYLY